jgi:hypothetical protein
MIQRCIFYLIMFCFLSCEVNNNHYINFEKIDIKVVESIRLIDKINFFQMPFKSQMVSDSLIVSVSGFSGLSIYNMFDGQQVDFINTRSDPKRPLFFSTFDACDFPNIYLLEAKQKMIYVYNFDKKEFVQIIPIDLEVGTSTPLMGGKFKKYQNEFYIELNSEKTSLIDPDYYNSSGKFMGIFDSWGGLKKRVIQYPKHLTHPEGYFVPDNYYSFDVFNDKLYICFPFEKVIRVYELKGNFQKYESIPLPILDNITLDLINISEKFNPQLIPIEERQISARVRNLIADSEKLYLSFAINDNEKTDRYREFISVFQLDLNDMKWKVQDKPVDVFDLGEFAGVSGERLVFFDSFLKTKDEKFVNLVMME